MRKINIKMFFTFLIIILTSCSWTSISEYSRPSNKTKNIILFIGDGMGVAHVYAGMTVKPQPLFLRMFPFSGFSITNSSDNYITDSAAGGTAIACGVKTNNGMIGVTPDNNPVSSIIELAHNKGLATGVVSTSAVTHATPASFVAHDISRDNYETIAEDFLNGTIDLFIGGGEDHFRNRTDGRDLALDLVSQGFDVIYNIDDLKASNSDKVAGLLAKVHMPMKAEGRGGMLVEMVQKAVETLSRDRDGFFLMVEGSMIDMAAHNKDINNVVSEMIDMDEAIGVALEFAKKDRETLIVVTADHETGGLTLTGGDINEHTIVTNFQGTNHTAVMVPVFSFGPGAEKFSGIHDNTFFLDEFINLLRIKR